MQATGISLDCQTFTSLCAPLHKAVHARMGNIVEALLEGDADYELQHHMGRTPLHLATMVQSEGIVEALLNTGANPNIEDLAGKTPLHYAAIAKNYNNFVVQYRRCA